MSADFLRRIKALEILVAAHRKEVEELRAQVQKLLEKRGPGRPPK
jgi:uncharacterized coiled-coil protein SlyX